MERLDRAGGGWEQGKEGRRVRALFGQHLAYNGQRELAEVRCGGLVLGDEAREYGDDGHALLVVELMGGRG